MRIPEDRRRHEILDGEIIEKRCHAQTTASRSLDPASFPVHFNRTPNGASRPGGWWFATELTIKLSRVER
ncbi:MAG: hypothetical protein U0787_18950 [Polyangia bacterium]